jgi:hypothetical protein
MGRLQLGRWRTPSGFLRVELGPIKTHWDATLTASTGASNDRLARLAVPWPVLLVAGLMVVGLLAVSGAYGFHGDEMYFIVAGQHPAFGYVDQPPLTPLLSAASVALFGVSPTAVRLLPAIEMGLIVILIALIARDLGISAPVISTPRPIPTCSPGRSSCGCW